MSLKKNENDLDILRDKVINSAIISISILITPVVVFSIYRFFHFGWTKFYWIYLIELIIILSLFSFRKKLPLKFKAHSIAVIAITFGLIGTTIYSLSGGNIQSFIGILIITIIYGRRIGIIYASFAIIAYAIIGFLFVNGKINNVFDFNVFNNSLQPWLNAVTLYSVIAFLIVYSIGLFYKYIVGSWKDILSAKDKLALINNELKENKIILENKNTALNKLNKEYLDSQIKFKTIFDVVKVGITITDDKGIIIDCNEASNKILGVSRKEHMLMDLDNTDWNIVYPDKTPMKNENLPGSWVLKNRKPVSNFVMGYTKKEDGIIWLNCDVIPLDIEGYGVVITLNDITESVNSREKLVEFSNQLQLMNTDKDKFIRILAHDLKSPFNSLIGLSSLLFDNIKYFDQETLKEYIGSINDTSVKTYMMLDDILVWLKSHSGQIVFSPKEINVNDFCNDVILSSNIMAKDKKVKLVFQSTNNERKIFFDPNITKTILRNLISNAIKFSREEDEVVISQEIVNDEMIISVKDNGIGISQENINKIWNPILSYKSNGTNGEKSNGLGLSICKELVEKQGGRIWVESDLGKGSSFKFSIPLNNLF